MLGVGGEDRKKIGEEIPKENDEKLDEAGQKFLLLFRLPHFGTSKQLEQAHLVQRNSQVKT